MFFESFGDVRSGMNIFWGAEERADEQGVDHTPFEGEEEYIYIRSRNGGLVFSANESNECRPFPPGLPQHTQQSDL